MESFGTGGFMLCRVFWRRWASERGLFEVVVGFFDLISWAFLAVSGFCASCVSYQGGIRIVCLSCSVLPNLVRSFSELLG